MCAGQYGECLGIEICFTGVHENRYWVKPMATGVFGHARGQTLCRYSNTNGLFLGFVASWMSL
jgi:hypothetical protein